MYGILDLDFFQKHFKKISPTKSFWTVEKNIFPYIIKIMQGLKFSGTVPDLRRAAFGKKKKKKNIPTFKKKIKFRVHQKIIQVSYEFTSSPTNGMRGTPLSLSTKLTLLANQMFLLL